MSNLATQAPKNVTQNRNIYVGGSDIPIILGLSKYKTQYQLALEKTGIAKNDFKGNEFTQFGNALEPQIRDFINITSEEYNFIETSTVDEEKQIRANTDGVCKETNTLLEIKTHGKHPTIDVYIPQMQLYMYVNNLEHGLLALYERPKDFDVEFNSERLEIMTINRDDQYINKILKEIDLFWQRVEWLKKNEGASEYDFNNSLEKKITGGKKDMENKLSVKTTKMTLPEIEFNYDELAKNLEENLKKYDGLTFTEKTVTECNRTIAELRKGKKLVDQYRLKTKKQLLGPVTEFENKCKVLNKKFDEVIKPLKEQSDEFEEKRKNEKEQEIGKLTRELYEEYGLSPDTRLEFDSKWLNKSTSMKSIKEDIVLQIEQLKLQQEKVDMDKQLIKSHVELMNAKHDVKLLETSYVHLAGTTETDEIKRLIEQDADTLVQRREEERKEKEQEQEQVIEAHDPVEEVDEETGELFIDVYEVTGTESQLDDLEEYMSSKGLAWKVVEEVN